MTLRIVFMGSPVFAVPSLEGLLAAGHDVALVLAQPDRPAGRGRQPTPPPVAAFARARGLPLFQPPSLKPPDAFARVRDAAPDIIVVAAYGLILRREVLGLPRLGCVNVHASLLPRHRGAAPISAAILAGDAETGICIMQMEVGLDTGPVYARRSTPIGLQDDTPTLTERLAVVGRELLAETLPRLAAGEIVPESQDDALATYAPKIQREDARLDWSLPAVELERRVRAYRGWPDAFTTWQGKGLKVLTAHVEEEALAPNPSPAHRDVGAADVRAAQRREQGGEGSPGHVVLVGKRPAVLTGEGVLVLDKVMLEGKRPADGADFVRGYRAMVGADLGG
ncbi:MAG: methionyl-tRNA formyltransferase [Chloroflexi bacterium]|nr:methionyl-tRNA formyltransferase [Chloroflexota bacterium]